MTYRVDVLKMGHLEVPGPEVYWMSHWEQWETLTFYMVLIRGNGKTIIINTGLPSDLATLNTALGTFAGTRCRLFRTEEERPLNALEKIGVRPESVDHVLLTPLQSYATANIPLFPRAEICFSRRGWIEDIMARPSFVHSPRQMCIPDDVLKYLLFQAWERVSLIEDECEVCPGIHAWWSGGHHRSSMVYSIEAAAGLVMVGDCAFKYGNLTRHPLGIAESLAECNVAYRRIQQNAAHFIPLYDPDVLVRYPSGEIK